jgi:hypothetical protein
MRDLRVTQFIAVIAVTAMCNVGCSYRSMLDRVAPKDEVEFARERLEELRAGRLDQLEMHFDAATSNPSLRSELERMLSYYPSGEPRSVELIGSQVGRGPGWWNANLTFQYEFPDAWMVANVFLSRTDGSNVVVKGMHLERIPDSLQHINAFSLAGKGALHYLILAAALLVVSFTIVSFVVCLRTPGLRRKWLWALFTLVGVTGVTINWTTGRILFVTESMHLLGAGAVASSPYSPWLLTVSFPLGAVLFFAKRSRLKGAEAAAVSATPSESREPDLQ